MNNTALNLVGLTYPAGIGCSIVFFGLKSRFLFKERFTPVQWVALFCCAGGILLLGVALART